MLSGCRECSIVDQKRSDPPVHWRPSECHEGLPEGGLHPTKLLTSSLQHWECALSAETFQTGQIHPESVITKMIIMLKDLPIFEDRMFNIQ